MLAMDFMILRFPRVMARSRLIDSAVITHFASAKKPLSITFAKTCRNSACIGITYGVLTASLLRGKTVFRQLKEPRQ